MKLKLDLQEHVNITKIRLASFKFDYITRFKVEQILYLIELYIKYNIYVNEIDALFSDASFCIEIEIVQYPTARCI